VWDHLVFSKNCDRLLYEKLADGYFDRVLKQASGEAEAPVPDAGNATECPASRGSTDTDAPEGAESGSEQPESATDKEARLYRKGKGAEAKLCYLGQALLENLNGLLENTGLTHADGTAERLAALEIIEEIEGRRRITGGADKAYDTKEFVRELCNLQATPHVAQNNKGRKSAIDGRVTSQPGYTVSLRIRKRLEQTFGWMKFGGRDEESEAGRASKSGLGVHLHGRTRHQSGATSQSKKSDIGSGRLFQQSANLLT